MILMGLGISKSGPVQPGRRVLVDVLTFGLTV